MKQVILVSTELRAFLLDSAAIAQIAFRRFFAPLSLTVGSYQSYFSGRKGPSVNTQTPLEASIVSVPEEFSDTDLFVDDDVVDVDIHGVSFHGTAISLEVDPLIELAGDLDEARTMASIGTKIDLARAYVDMGDPEGARDILKEVLGEADEANKEARELLSKISS